MVYIYKMLSGVFVVCGLDGVFLTSCLKVRRETDVLDRKHTLIRVHWENLCYHATRLLTLIKKSVAAKN